MLIQQTAGARRLAVVLGPAPVPKGIFTEQDCIRKKV